MSKDFAFGVDISLLKYIEDRGVAFKDCGKTKDPLRIFADHGVNSVRLRLFVEPDYSLGQVNDLQYTLALARRVADHGLSLLLDIHYSDGWADPAQQRIPRIWLGKDFDALTSAVSQYTTDVICAFDQAGCVPDLVQIGNEVTNGMLWPIGQLTDEGGWARFAGLLGAGRDGARAGGYDGEILIHVDQGGSKDICAHFFDSLLEHEVQFDLIGLSYYPFWHGKVDDLRENLAFLAGRYGRPLIVLETGHDWRGECEAGAAFPATPAGQRQFFQAVVDTTLATPQSLGAGVYYWAPEWIMGSLWGGPQWSDVWESRALFDDQGSALPALKVFEKPRMSSRLNVRNPIPAY